VAGLFWLALRRAMARRMSVDTKRFDGPGLGGSRRTSSDNLLLFVRPIEQRIICGHHSRRRTLVGKSFRTQLGLELEGQGVRAGASGLLQRALPRSREEEQVSVPERAAGGRGLASLSASVGRTW
jgi:hypothetical protein